MARVVPVGPIDPEPYAFAKKEAEKAERNPRYVPKKRETPAHTVFYRRAGATVKAFVIDKIAPITFSSPGSAIPIRPNFLHLHSELPKKVYGRENLSMSNSREYCDASSPLADSYTAYAGINAAQRTSYWAEYWLYNYYLSITRLGVPRPTYAIQYAHGKSVLRNAILANWHAEDGEFSDRKAPWLDENDEYYPYDADANNDGTVINTHRDVFSRTNGHTVQKQRITFEPVESSTIRVVRSDFAETVTADVSGAFLSADIRDARTDDGYITTQKSAMRSIASANMNNTSGHVLIHYNSHVDMNSDVVQFGLHTTVCSFSGAVLFPAVLSKFSATTDAALTTVSFNYDIQLSPGIFKNLDDKVICKEDVSVTQSFAGPTSQAPTESNNITPRRTYAYILCSTESEFPGVMLWVTALSPELQPILYGAESNVVKAGMLDMFSMRGGDNRGAPSLLPSMITDGICTRYAWFFVNRYYEYSEPSRDVSNKISVIVFPDEGDNWHDIESLTVHSVELTKRTPRYVVAPGESIFISLARYYHGEYVPPSPYTINGIVEEKGSDGQPTGMYLAGDGTISGILSDEGVTFDISPRQPPGVPRVVDVEVQTERTHPARARFEVVSATPCAASMTIELANQGAILAGQSAVFYLTVTGFADGARIPYEITMGDQKVAERTAEVVSGVSVIWFAPSVYVQYIKDTGYRLLNPYEPYSLDASTNNFKISINHQAAPPPLSFSVLYGTTTHQTPSGRPETPRFLFPYINAEVIRDGRSGDKERWVISSRCGLLGQVWYSIKTKRVYVTYWDGRSCEVSNILKKNPESGKYEFNPDWKEVPFDYQPAVDPYEIKGTLEPYVYAYMDYEASLTGE